MRIANKWHSKREQVLCIDRVRSISSVLLTGHGKLSVSYLRYSRWSHLPFLNVSMTPLVNMEECQVSPQVQSHGPPTSRSARLGLSALSPNSTASLWHIGPFILWVRQDPSADDALF